MMGHASTSPKCCMMLNFIGLHESRHGDLIKDVDDKIQMYWGNVGTDTRWRCNKRVNYIYRKFKKATDSQ